MLQDPFTLYCYWEVAPETQEAHLHDGEEYVLTIHPDGAERFDVTVRGSVASSYINLENGGGTYFVELSHRTPSGDLLPLLRSNTVILPPVGVSETEDERWWGEGEPAAGDLLRPAGLPEHLLHARCREDLSSAALVKKEGR